MEHYRYVIRGGGMTTDAALRSVSELDSSRQIGVITAESDPPCSRLFAQPGFFRTADLLGRLLPRQPAVRKRVTAITQRVS